MMTFMRTIVDIPDKVIETLDQIGSTAHRSRAALIRDAINSYLCEHHREESTEAFGIWKDKITDGVEYQRRVRNEWGN